MHEKKQILREMPLTPPVVLLGMIGGGEGVIAGSAPSRCVSVSSRSWFAPSATISITLAFVEPRYRRKSALALLRYDGVIHGSPLVNRKTFAQTEFFSV